MAVLGVDFGLRRMGIAFTGESATVAFAGPGITGEEEACIRQIAKEAQSRKATEIVVGLPKHMDGGETEMTRRVIEFAEKLRQAVPVKVTTWDERLTSVQAERAMLSGDLSRKKRRKRVDSLAAQLMLQDYLDARRNRNDDGT